MHYRIRSVNKIARSVAIVTVLGLLASNAPSAWAQRGQASKARGKQSAARGQQTSRSGGRAASSLANRSHQAVAGRKSTKPTHDVRGSRLSMSEASRTPTGRQQPGRHPQSSAREGGPLYPAGWEQLQLSRFRSQTAVDPFGRDDLPSIRGGKSQRNGRVTGGGIWNSNATQNDGGLKNSTTGSLQNQNGSVSNQRRMPPHSSFYGQDQETGEIIDFRAGLSAGSQPAPTGNSIVNSEGWDEVPEDLMFGFRPGASNRRGRIIKSLDVESPRDLASGLPTGRGR